MPLSRRQTEALRGLRLGAREREVLKNAAGRWSELAIVIDGTPALTSVYYAPPDRGQIESWRRAVKKLQDAGLIAARSTGVAPRPAFWFRTEVRRTAFGESVAALIQPELESGARIRWDRVLRREPQLDVRRREEALDDARDEQRETDQLQSDLDAAIKAEDYEKAAELRDKIAALRSRSRERDQQGG